MAKNKKLGMGLDLLLTGAEGKNSAGQAKMNYSWTGEMLEEALGYDEEGDFLEAYYLYRRLIDLAEDAAMLNDEGEASQISQALNNAAIILYEHGYNQKARAYLEKSIAIEPENQVARSNLEQLNKS